MRLSKIIDFQNDISVIFVMFYLLDYINYPVLSMLNVNRLYEEQTKRTVQEHLEEKYSDQPGEKAYFQSGAHYPPAKLKRRSAGHHGLRKETKGPLKITNNFTFEEIAHKLLEGYEKHHRPGNAGDPTLVEVNMYVQRFGSINVIDMDYSIDLLLRQRWMEPRLRFEGYNHSLSLSYLKNSLWIPDLFFRNSKFGFLHEVTTPNNLIWLQSDGTLVFSQKLTVRLSCPMQLWKFPMDQQVCPLEIGSYGFSIKELEFVWWKKTEPSVTLNKNLVLNEFETPHVTTGICTKNYNTTGAFACLYVRFQMKRKFGFYLIYTYVPSMLIVTISWISFWIDYKAVPARITLGLLCVLALMTQSAATVQKLPRVSYVKAIDVWLFACLAFVVAALLEFALVNMIARRREQQRLRDDLRNLMQKEMKLLRGNINIRNHAQKDARQSQDELQTLNDEGDNRRSDLHDAHGFVAYKVDNIFVFLYPICFTLFNIIYWFGYLSVED